jgi:hypothetical protein
MTEMVILGLSLLCVVASLGMGLKSFIRAEPSQNSAFWMRARILLQGIAIALLGLFFYGRIL